MDVEPLKSESASFMGIQDFTRKQGTPHNIKTDNARTETGEKWTEHCRRFHIGQKCAEPMFPWKNHAEHAIRDLSVMVPRTMKQHEIPLMHHY